jgi:hypothetical protein
MKSISFETTKIGPKNSSCFRCNSTTFPAYKPDSEYTPSKSAHDILIARWAVFRAECWNLEVLRSPVIDNSNSSNSNSSSCMNGNSNSSDDSVFDPEELNSQWSLASDVFKGDLVNQFLAKEIAKQAGSSHDKPVEIIVRFDNNQHTSLFAIKHKREKGAKSAKGRKNINADNDIAVVAAEDNDFINFSRRISHELLTRIVKTQGSKEADVKRSIANLAHQVHTLNPEAYLTRIPSRGCIY